jgi:hypothetical protein
MNVTNMKETSPEFENFANAIIERHNAEVLLRRAADCRGAVPIEKVVDTAQTLFRQYPSKRHALTRAMGDFHVACEKCDAAREAVRAACGVKDTTG